MPSARVFSQLVSQTQTKCTLRPFCAQGGLHGKVSPEVIEYSSWRLTDVQGRSLSRFPTSARHLQTTLPLKRMRVLAQSSQISSGMCSIHHSRRVFVFQTFLRYMQDPISRAQREGLRPSDCNAGHGRAQVGRILAYEEALRV